MRNQRIRVLAAVLTLAASSVVAFAVATPAGAVVPGQVVITEWMYNPIVERLRVRRGDQHRRRTGRHDRLLVRRRQPRPGHVLARRLGTLAAGESGLIVETTAAAFRTEWGLDASVKIAASNTNNLGRGDEINIFNGATLADRLTYGDDVAFPGSIRTQGISGVPTTCVPLGANNVRAWVLSAVGDGRGSKALGARRHRFARHHPARRVRAGHDRRWRRQRQPNTSPCQPEAASGTGPAPAGAQTWPGGHVGDGGRSGVRLEDHHGAGGPRHERPRVRSDECGRAVRREEQELGVPPREAGRPVGARHRQRLGRRQADLLPRRRRPARLRGPHGRRRRCALRDDRARQRQQLGRPELRPAIRPDRRGHHAHRRRSSGTSRSTSRS